MLSMMMVLGIMGCDTDGINDNETETVAWPTSWVPKEDTAQGGKFKGIFERNDSSEITIRFNCAANNYCGLYLNKSGGTFSAKLISVKNNKEFTIKITEPGSSGYSKDQELPLCTNWTLSSDGKTLALSGGLIDDISSPYTWTLKD